MESDQIIVSICCLAYNHEPYIRKCLDGFIMQKTNFKYEVLIHDDASTDNTANVIKEYEEKYPDIIKPIYQKENQYSKGIPITRLYQRPRAKGKYIALCEGDDYWTDELKLQKQVDFLEKNPEYSICVHQATLHNCKTGIDSNVNCELEDKDFSLEEIVKGTGALFATNSILMKNEVYVGLPECFKAVGFGDYQLLMYGAIVGKCRYFSKNMSVYNFQSSGSWTSSVNESCEGYINKVKEVIRMLNCVNDYYEYLYDDIFRKTILNEEYRLHVRLGNIIKIHNPIYRDFYLKDLNDGVKPDVSCIINRFPSLYMVYSNIKRKVLK